MEQKELSTALRSFECRQCNECCRQAGFVYLQRGEESRIANYLGLDDFKFANEYCDVEDRRALVLKKHADETCVFLTDSGCTIHEVKPQQCRDFPTRWRTKRSFKYCEGLKNLGIQT